MRFIKTPFSIALFTCGHLCDVRCIYNSKILIHREDHHETFERAHVACLSSVSAKAYSSVRSLADGPLYTLPEIRTCMQQPLALASKELYFPHMKYFEIVFIFTLSIFFKKCENNENVISFNYKIHNLHKCFS